MVDLTPENPPLATLQAPRSSVSPGQIAEPYTEFAQALDKSGEALGVVADKAAEQAGYKAVTRDDAGNVQIEKAPIIGPASAAYSRAVKFAALAEGEASLRQADIRMRREFHDNPEGYLKASDEFKAGIVKQYTDAGGADLGITLGRTIDQTTTQTFKGLQLESERLEMQRADKSITSEIASTQNNMFAMARGGDTSSDAFKQASAKVDTLMAERVNNPRLAYPPDAAKYDREQFDGHLKGNAFLYHIDQVYKDDGVNEDGSTKGGAANALEAAKSILSDQSIKLTPEQRQQFFNKATAEIRANEALRRQDVSEARAAGQELSMRSAVGMPVDPTEVEQVAKMHRDAGDPGGAARLYATFARKPLNDAFGTLPIAEQTRQLNELRGAPRQEAAYNFFVDKGWSPAQAAGIVGGLRGETAGLDTTQLHDGGIGIGISGWNGPRRAALNQFAADNKMSPTDLRTQLEFVHHELTTSEKAAGDQLRGAQTPEQAGNAMLNYFRPSNYDVPGAHPERAYYARNVFSAFNDGDPAATKIISEHGPAGSLWLQANRSTVLQKNARQAWSTVVSDYDKTGIRPADEAINQITSAARATNDHALLEGIAQKTDQMALAQNVATRSLPEQHAAITQLQTAGAEGVLSPGQRGVLQDLERRNEAITKGLKENPVATAVQNFPERFNAPAPLNMKDPQQFTAGLQMRAQVAQFAQQNWQTKPLSALDAPDLAQVSAALDTPDPAVKGQIFQALSTLPEDVRNATLAKIGEKRPDFMVAAAAGSLMKEAPDVAQSILRGQEAIKADKGYLPTGPGAAVNLAEELDKRLPAGAFSLAGRTTDNGPYEVARGMIKARYADLSAQTNDTTGKVNNERLQQATDDVTGGILKMNGGTLLAPRRGMMQREFDDTIRGVSANDLAGVTTLNGQPVTPDYLQQSAQLESIGSGRYQVRLGKDPLRPIYAYQNANTEAPTKYILDLRGRPQVQATYDPLNAGGQTP